MLLIALAAVSLALLVLVAVMVRVFRNVGPLDLEDYARRNHVVYIPVGQKLAEQLGDWSKPLRIRLEQASHPMLATMVIKKLDEEPAE
jgi:hypothetical protein